ncbi:hypothetical protein BJ878DRAFT_546915 [Calycina marina]|uniref:Cupin type-2 domain-containing protein n=1 Tax=Calycina marina TaxID=1763456 RepID=A0A9P7YUX7_9HELO|nr:hypothetical protein BJ878DRAFT_546915 [Calycina marina]
MDSVKTLKVLNIGKGQTMEIKIDESQPEDSVLRYAMDTISTGEEALDTPPHWHKNHDEHFSVLEGRLEFTLDGKEMIIKAGDPETFVPRRKVHQVKGFKGERLVFRERPDPAGMYKALFFNDVFAYGSIGPGNIWHTLRAFYDGDAYIALPLRSQVVDQVFITLFGGLARLFVAKKEETL